jgi:D-alanyl-D-alanine carboxypeptidase
MNTNTTSFRSPRRRGRTIIALSAAAALTVGAVAFGAWSRVDTTAAAATRLTERMQGLVQDGFPAALASVITADGRGDAVAVGTKDLESGAEPPVDGEVRIGSNTKTYVATIVLQLVEEGQIELDEPIETYLPALVAGEGIDGATITVRQLLQHTSGLPEYATEIAADAFGAQNLYISPRDLLDVALAKPAVFAPGERWEYSNTNYLVLGVLIERLTERPLHEQIDERIVEPLGLDHTYLPVPGEREVRGTHPLGYHQGDTGALRDITAMDPSFAWAAGAMIATPSDLNRFMQAVLDGELLSEASLAEMQAGVPAGDDLWPDAVYGLGLQGFPLSCGGVAWGHGGDIPGTQTRNAVGPDGTAVTIAVTALPWALVDVTHEKALLAKYQTVVDALDETLCDS